jgi:Skp family chaperone for outer membrane proteins
MTYVKANLQRSFTMKKSSTLLATLVLAACSTFAFAQAPAAAPADKEPMMKDCSKEAPDKAAQCEAYNKAVETCKDKKGDELKACMKEAMPKKDK